MYIDASNRSTISSSRAVSKKTLLAAPGRVPRRRLVETAGKVQPTLASRLTILEGGPQCHRLRFSIDRRSVNFVMGRPVIPTKTKALVGSSITETLSYSEKPKQSLSQNQAFVRDDSLSRLKAFVSSSKARHGQTFRRDSQRLDYPGNANDQFILRLPPKTKLAPEDVLNVFKYPRNFKDRYEMAGILGHGSFGTVFRVVDRVTGELLACKSIAKVPAGKCFSSPHHLLKVRSEIDCMARLGYSLDAVCLVGQYEDDTHVHLVMELCDDGTLMEAMQQAETTEDDVALVMRSVFRFIALCHSRDLVFRDVKPENFLFTSDADSRTRVLKATDFGLAIHLEDGGLPLTMPAGTPIYVAPEVLDRCYGKPCDVYSAGVMAFQLLTGRYPYWPDMDFTSPSINQLVHIIKTSEIDFTKLSEEGLSKCAIDFLQLVLVKDPRDRMTAEEALHHPWIQDRSGSMEEVPLNGTAVQRLQRYAVYSQLKQEVLLMIFKGICESDDRELLDQIMPSDTLGTIRSIFDGMDTQNVGAVTVDSIMKELAREGYSLSCTETRQLLHWVGSNNDGRVKFEDFACSLVDWEHAARSGKWKQLLKQAFDSLDLNKDGSISPEDIKEWFACLDNGIHAFERSESADAMVRDFDADYDGGISFTEFLHNMLSCNNSEYLECFDKRQPHLFASGTMWDSSRSITGSLSLDDPCQPITKDTKE